VRLGAKRLAGGGGVAVGRRRLGAAEGDGRGALHPPAGADALLRHLDQAGQGTRPDAGRAAARGSGARPIPGRCRGAARSRRGRSPWRPGGGSRGRARLLGHRSGAGLGANAPRHRPPGWGRRHRAAGALGGAGGLGPLQQLAELGEVVLERAGDVAGVGPRGEDDADDGLAAGADEDVDRCRAAVGDEVLARHRPFDQDRSGFLRDARRGDARCPPDLGHLRRRVPGEQPTLAGQDEGEIGPGLLADPGDDTFQAQRRLVGARRLGGQSPTRVGSSRPGA
jgi:hypothetical protein